MVRKRWHGRLARAFQSVEVPPVPSPADKAHTRGFRRWGYLRHFQTILIRCYTKMKKRLRVKPSLGETPMSLAIQKA